MNLSMKWLKDFVNIDIPPKEFTDALTMSGSKVESYKIEGGNSSKIVVGRILFIDEHPNANRLFVCKVHIGEEKPIQIVTSATNIKAGDLVPVALDGSTLADGTKIKSSKLRGILSSGMFCSINEIGITKDDFPNADPNGIFILDKSCKIGQNVCEAIGFDDTIIEFEITPNRTDCLSVIGLAREVAATFNKLLKLHTPYVKGGAGTVNDILNINVEDKELCKFYSAKVVNNIKIEPSPRWMRERLISMGIKPINNIVDITNYVMLEYGQPMHAFDLNAVKDSKIIVRRSNDNEEITTLDNCKRKLTNSDLVIADSEKPIAIAGIIGGEFSGITDNTKTIVFESANFDAASIRNTAKKQGLNTDASKRYQKGLNANNCIPALQRACELVEMLDAGDVTDGIIEKSNIENTQISIKLDCDWINKFLNISLTKDEMKNILKRIGCSFDDDNIIVPTYRKDLEHKADIAEEIARFYGYNKIPSSPLNGIAEGQYTEKQNFYKKINEAMLALGVNEIKTYSFISPKEYDKILLPEDSPLRNSVVISNPLGEDTSIMRTTALPSMLGSLARNYNNRNECAYLFELAKEYSPLSNADELPLENDKLIAGFYSKESDFFEIKGIAEELLHKLGIINYNVEAYTEGVPYHPGKCAEFTVNNSLIGIVGEIHPDVCKNYNISSNVYVIYFDITILFNNHITQKKYVPLPKYPAISRDLALVCDESVPVGLLQKTIKQASGDILENITLFDIYKGKQIEQNKKSVAFRIYFRSSEHTLTDEEISSVMNEIMSSIKELDVKLRV